MFDNVPFNIRYYFHRALFYLTIPIFSILFYYFGYTSERIDLISIGALIISCALCWADKDTLGALIIVLGFWIISRIIYFLPVDGYYLVFIYVMFIGICAYCINQVTAKITLVIIFYSMGAELYWYHINYANKPHIYYVVGLLALNELMRELLLNRVFILYRCFNYISGKIALDWQLRTIALVYYLLVLASTIEYFIRHLAGYSYITFVYDSFSPIASILSGACLTIIYMHYFYNQSKKHISA